MRNKYNLNVCLSHGNSLNRSSVKQYLLLVKGVAVYFHSNAISCVQFVVFSVYVFFFILSEYVDV